MKDELQSSDLRFSTPFASSALILLTKLSVLQPQVEHQADDDQLVTRLRADASPVSRGYARLVSHVGTAWVFAESEILRLQEQFALELSRAHAFGYSTNRHDLIHDLFG